MTSLTKEEAKSISKDRIEKFSDCISTLKTTVNRRNFIETLDELSTAIYFKNEEGENNDRKNR